MKLVVHCKKEKFDVYIGRPSIWGNPFTLPKKHTRQMRDEVVEKYRKWIMSKPEILAKIPSLTGKVLGCWCAPNACHGDVLAELANPKKGFFEKMIVCSGDPIVD